jgi:Type I phosphodiesterase / nucleotide pyrophosphatase
MKRFLALALVLVIGAGTGIYFWPQHRNSSPAPRPTAPILLEADGGTATPAPAASRPARISRDGRYLVLVVLDGARPDYFNVSGIPHIQALMKSGTRYNNAWAGILESETPTGHASIATGSTPSADGILSFNWATSDNTTINLFNPSEIQNGHMEQLIRNAPAPTIAELVHRKYPSSKVVSLGGHKYYAQDALGGPNADAIVYYTGDASGHFIPVSVPGHVPPASILNDKSLTASSVNLPMGSEDHIAMRLAIKTFQVMQPRVMLVNMPEFDWPLGHVDGGDRDPAGVRSLMQGFDKDLGSLEDAYRKAGLLNRTIFVLTADHGLAPIYHTVSQDAIDQAVSRAGTSIISDTYHTASYIWLKDSSVAVKAATNISALGNPYIQAVYFKSSLAGGGYRYLRASGPALFHAPAVEQANQYLLGTFNGPNGPDVAVLFDEDAASLPGGQASWKGDHGGAAWQSQHLPLVISGAGVRHGVVSNRPARLMDIAPTVLTLMGIAPSGMQGTPLADAMLGFTSTMWAAQERQVRSQQPVIAALQAESSRELQKGL